MRPPSAWLYGAVVAVLAVSITLPAARAAVPRRQHLLGRLASASPVPVPDVGPLGIDIADYQGDVPWSTVYAEGVRWAYIKATQGTSLSNSYFQQQYDGAYSVGIVRGAYVFAVPNIASGAATASFFASNGGGWSADGMTLPGMVDLEPDPYPLPSGQKADGPAACYGLDASQMVSWIRSFVDTYESAVGRWPTIYSDTNWWDTCTGSSTAFNDGPYLDTASWPNPSTLNASSRPGPLPPSWSTYTMWQFYSGGTLPSASGVIAAYDQDVFNGSYAQLKAFATGAGAPAAAPPSRVNDGTRFNAGSQPVMGSPNGDYKLFMQGDGDLVLDGPSGPEWSTDTSGDPGAWAILQGDGNLVVYSPSAQPLWNSHTFGQSGDSLQLDDAGHLKLISPAGHVVWTTGPAQTFDSPGRTGSYLYQWQELVSSNGEYRLVEQGSDGNLVLYGASGPVWDAGTYGHPGAWTVLQGDGNLVVYAPGGLALWNSGTGGNLLDTVAVTDNGQVQIVSSTGQLLWTTGQAVIDDGTRLHAGQSVTSYAGQFRLVMQGDGNLVLYRHSGQALWNTGTYGHPGSWAVLQGDGNLVVYSPVGQPLWFSGTEGNPGDSFQVTGAGSPEIIASTGRIIWTG